MVVEKSWSCGRGGRRNDEVVFTGEKAVVLTSDLAVVFTPNISGPSSFSLWYTLTRKNTLHRTNTSNRLDGKHNVLESTRNHRVRRR